MTIFGFCILCIWLMMGIVCATVYWIEALDYKIHPYSRWHLALILFCWPAFLLFTD